MRKGCAGRLLKSDAFETCGVLVGFAWRRLRAGLAVYQ